jgi:PhzF family phenazine biosynthesis protein
LQVGFEAVEILRYAAFSSDPAGGNPAGVVLDATGASEVEMQRVATEVGFSETAFLVPRNGNHFDVRYFSPLAEVPFCGHATIASGVAYADRHGVGRLEFATPSGPVEVKTASDAGQVTATLVSVAPRTVALGAALLDDLVRALRWSRDDLDPALPPAVGYAGVWHPIIGVRTRERLAELDYDFDALGELMARNTWTTVDLVWRESRNIFHARNPFPPGGVVEDPATGAAAAAFGGYLREQGLIALPAVVIVHQGEDMGRPSMLTVEIPDRPGSGISVTGTAVALDPGVA